ncbi:TPA: hypothetical protein ACQVH3_003623 [Serratia marcescens]
MNKTNNPTELRQRLETTLDFISRLALGHDTGHCVHFANKAEAELLCVIDELEAKDAPKDIRIAELEKRLKQRAEEAESHIAELEAHKQYAKERDAENESLALTVGRLRVELEAKDQRIAELEAKLTRREAASVQPYGYLRENDGQIQISIGPERPHDRSGGYATPWSAIYTMPPKPTAPEAK